MLADQTRLSSLTLTEIESRIETDARENLY